MTARVVVHGREVAPEEAHHTVVVKKIPEDREEAFREAETASQPTVVHEFGHVLGLPDEYVEETDATDRPAGDPETRSARTTR